MNLVQNKNVKYIYSTAYVVFGTYGTEPWFGENVISEVILKGKYRRHNAHVLLVSDLEIFILT